ncbi:hemolysin family protein [Shouchella lehensis]|uniref:HlyC/CorC family transporter n=1 Tax=Shouchella lehensis TaxID=300825 RepID=A0A4Y7WJL6_9BACI|nr:hemolysin family protein [Shouchella lehensis]MBG9785988.1 membrane protein [Shouchella lehensis]TES48467.1 HlyC/CorC family transporter [Shouchella lehensis]
MDISTVINLLGVALLIILTAFFVASEFAIVKVRSTQLEPHIEGGSKRALAAKKVTSNLDEYLSACQLGITITALGIGRLAEPTFERMLHPIIGELSTNEAFVTTLSIFVSFTFATFLHVVIGELAPKTIAIQKAEQVTLFIGQPLVWFYRLLYPFIWVLNGSARLLIKVLGFKPMSEHEVHHSEEELRLILSDSLKSGEINQSEFNYVSKVFEFDERIAKEIMVPRTEMVTISLDYTDEDILSLIKNHSFTRYPVISEDKDSIVGVLNVRDFLSSLLSKEEKNQLGEIVYPVITVFETVRIRDILIEMQQKHIHMAILFDEYGGTAGLVTLEDILEEIVGDIRDEYDVDEPNVIEEIEPNHYRIQGQTPIHDVNQELALDLESNDAETIAGWLYEQQYDLAEGDEIPYNGYTFIIRHLNGNQLHEVDILKT